MYPWYNVYETKDRKYVSIATLEPKFFANLCRLLLCEQFIPHQFEEGQKREEMFQFFTEKFRTRTRDEWTALLMHEETCYAPVLGIDELEFDPQLIARRMILESNHPTAGRLKQIGSMHKLSDSPVEVRNWATGFGQHTNEILREMAILTAVSASCGKRGGGVAGRPCIISSTPTPTWKSWLILIRPSREPKRTALWPL